MAHPHHFIAADLPSSNGSLPSHLRLSRPPTLLGSGHPQGRRSEEASCSKAQRRSHLAQSQSDGDRPAFNAESQLGNGTRWERALRLVYDRVTQAWTPPSSESDEDSLQTLSMLAL
ncbi:hypothetical protein F0562_012900 [Nyssa sinensis]|uniref:Uncharacterized protein n=1 Tax=Nyssa sinensis TaxID=561372 RepID=A0A5J4ZYV6_9ASTE|nr:hypothetical protein F0562_012900 [Nyssa sinensis]